MRLRKGKSSQKKSLKTIMKSFGDFKAIGESREITKGRLKRGY